MVWKLSVKHGRRCREEVPFIQDLLFVNGTRLAVDPIVEKYNTVQYRYLRGGYKIPMTVRETDMQRFIHAVESSENPCYYTPEEISADMIGRKVRIVGGPLDGYEGNLQKIHKRPSPDCVCQDMMEAVLDVTKSGDFPDAELQQLKEKKERLKQTKVKLGLGY